MAFPTPDKSYYPPHLVVRPTEAFVSICPNVSSVGVLGASPTGGIEIAAGLDGRDMLVCFIEEIVRLNERNTSNGRSVLASTLHPVIMYSPWLLPSAQQSYPTSGYSGDSSIPPGQCNATS